MSGIEPDLPSHAKVMLGISVRVWRLFIVGLLGLLRCWRAIHGHMRRALHCGTMRGSRELLREWERWVGAGRVESGLMHIWLRLRLRPGQQDLLLLNLLLLLCDLGLLLLQFLLLLLKEQELLLQLLLVLRLIGRVVDIRHRNCRLGRLDWQRLRGAQWRARAWLDRRAMADHLDHLESLSAAGEHRRGG